MSDAEEARAAQTAEPPVDYADFRVWLAEHDTEVARQQAEWDAQIADAAIHDHAYPPDYGRTEKIAAAIRGQFQGTAALCTESDRWLAEHDKRVAAEALEDAAVSLWGDSSAEPGTTKAQYNAIYATWLEQRAAR